MEMMEHAEDPELVAHGQQYLLIALGFTRSVRAFFRAHRRPPSAPAQPTGGFGP